ncbi:MULTISPECIES: hypothetical protein [unclassified Methanoregula]|uniref:hypothetical protein n=1 Tax=unclassified Methanoregula TaxID=2649730 RepID=UPI0009CA6892|nr:MULTISPECIES: hypothetical protein [unclassified Methanoregula]OPX62521.1 MAG: hypothetical protein A4E33_02270 [Methanoregula sp. PtaB.Bin085]
MLFLIFPIIALGKKARIEKILLLIVPYCGAMIVTSVLFALRLRQIQGRSS